MAVPKLCEECGSPLAADQRYCLVCGARSGERGETLEELRRGARDSWPARGQDDAGAPRPAAPPAAAQAGGLPFRMPPRGVSALIVAAFLGFGVLLGAAGSSVPSTLASGGTAALHLVVPAGGSSPPASTSTSSSEVPPAESTPSPAPAPAASTPATTPASSAAGEGAGEGSSEGSGSGSSPSAEAGTPTGGAKSIPAIRHVFVITLSNEPYAAVFGPESKAAYLAQTLEKKGALLVRYDAVAHEQLADGIALLSGQGPTKQTAGNCTTYSPLSQTGTGSGEQVLGDGCVYPQGTRTVLSQLAAKKLSWRAYVEGIGEAGSAQPACAHPSTGAADPTAAPESGAYATFRNAPVYFASVTGSAACATSDVGMSALSKDLASSTPSLSWIVPDRCHDGDTAPCTSGAPAGMGPANSFLQKVVPEILGSKAYKESGLLVITVDEAPSSGEFADSSSCCGQPVYPNIGPPAFGGHGGGTVGALLLSPYIKGGQTTQTQYNHFSLLRTVEDVFGLSHLGYAALGETKSFEAALFSTKKVG